MSRPTGTIEARYNNFAKWNGRHIPDVHPHAILSADKTVLQIRSYPRTTSSNNVVPIPDGPIPKIGWIYNPTTKTFHSPE